MNELLLINEVKEYIESERAKRKAVAEKNFHEKANTDHDTDTPVDRIAFE